MEHKDEYIRPSKKSANFIENFNDSIHEVKITFDGGFVNFDCDLFLSTHIKCHASSEEEFLDIMNGIIEAAKKQGFAN